MSSLILILTNSIPGFISFRKELIDSLKHYGYRVMLAAPDHTLSKLIEDDKCIIIPIKYLTRRGTNPLTDLKLLGEYIKILRKYKPSIVLSYTIKPNLYGGIACQILNIPYIVNITGLGTAVEEAGILQKLTIMMYKLAMRKVSKIFFQNDSNLKFFLTNKISNI